MILLYVQQMEQFKYEKQDEAVQRLRLHSNRDARILQQEAEMLQARWANLAQRREMIYGQHQELQDNVRQMGAFSSDLQVRQLDLESNQETLNRIGEVIQTLQLEMELRPQIEVVHDAHGRPALRLHGAVQAAYRSQELGSVHLSLSHDGDMAAAFVVVEHPVNG